MGFLTDQRDVRGGGLNLQTGPHLGLAGGQSGGHGGGAQTLIGGVIINQQCLTAISGEQVRGQRSDGQKRGKRRGKTDSLGRILGHGPNPEETSGINRRVQMSAGIIAYYTVITLAQG